MPVRGGFYPGIVGSHGRYLSRGGSGLLVRELSLAPMEWAVLDNLKWVEEMPPQNGNMNGKNYWLNQPSQIT